jgi:hypothetical protein
LEDQILRLLLTHPTVALGLSAETRRLLTAQPMSALSEVIDACEAAGEGATLATVSIQLAQRPDAEMFSELVAQVMKAPEVEREGAEEELVLLARKLRALGIKKELDSLARSPAKDAATLQKIRTLMDEQRQLLGPTAS